MHEKRIFPEPRSKVIHPAYGEATVMLVDTGYANGRGWIACNFGNAGGFACYPDEVEIVEEAPCQEVSA